MATLRVLLHVETTIMKEKSIIKDIESYFLPSRECLMLILMFSVEIDASFSWF